MKKWVSIAVAFALLIACGLFLWKTLESKSNAELEAVDTSPIVQFKEERMQFFVCCAVKQMRVNQLTDVFDLTENQCASVEELGIRYATEYETLEDLLLMKNLKTLYMIQYPEPENLEEFREQREARSQEILEQLAVILPQLEQLTELSVGEDLTVHDLSFLQEIHTLKSLTLTCKLENIAGIDRIQGLEDIGISTDLVDITPLAALENLVEVDLRDNQIVDISPLQNLEKLEIALLRNNQISDITPLMGLKNLKVIWLTGNPVCEDEEQMKALQGALPDTQIDYFNQ